MDVKRLRLRIPGKWEDGWLYRDQFLLWDADGRLHSASVSSIQRTIEKEYDRHLRVLADHLALRSERKSAADMDDVLQAPGVARKFFAPMDGPGDLVLDLPTLEMVESRTEPIPGRLTDVSVYGNRLFVGSDEGVFESRFVAKDPELSSPLNQVTDSPATTVVAGAGQLAASLGDAGLISREVSFGEGEDWTDTAEDTPVATLAEYSRRVTRSSLNLLNYGEHAAPSLIRAETRREINEVGYLKTLVTGYSEPVDLEGKISSVLDRPAADSPVDLRFEVLGNADYRLLVSRSGSLAVLNIRAFASKDKDLGFDKRFHFDSEAFRNVPRPLTTHQLRSGFLVEHLEGVHVLTDRGVIELSREIPVQVRSFPQSKRYIDTTLIVGEDFAELVGFVDLHEFK